MGTSETESCKGFLQTQFKHLPPQLALRSSLVRLQELNVSTCIQLGTSKCSAESLVCEHRVNIV